jgi:hypothetical protein
MLFSSRRGRGKEEEGEGEGRGGGRGKGGGGKDRSLSGTGGIIYCGSRLITTLSPQRDTTKQNTKKYYSSRELKYDF